VNHLIVSLFATDPDVIFASINPDFLALAMSELSMGIPKNLISAMSAFVVCPHTKNPFGVGVNLFFGFDGDFLWHKFISISHQARTKAEPIYSKRSAPLDSIDQLLSLL